MDSRSEAAPITLVLTTEADRERAEALAPLRQALDTLHSYDTPECLHWTASASAAYDGWLQEALAPQVLPHQRLE